MIENVDNITPIYMEKGIEGLCHYLGNYKATWVRFKSKYGDISPYSTMPWDAIKDKFLNDPNSPLSDADKVYLATYQL